jgi:hypothetical protein
MRVRYGTVTVTVTDNLLLLRHSSYRKALPPQYPDYYADLFRAQSSPT